MNIKQKGVTLNIEEATGHCFLRYNYPITPAAKFLFESMKEALNVEVIELKRKNTTYYYCRVKLYGSSTEVMPRFQIIQKSLMALSRRSKVEILNREIGDIEQMIKIYEQ